MTRANLMAALAVYGVDEHEADETVEFFTMNGQVPELDTVLEYLGCEDGETS